MRLLHTIVLTTVALTHTATAAPVPVPKVYESPLTARDRIIASFTVHDFGARGDGETDDTAAIQAAFDAAHAIGGAVVFAPAGRYAIRGRLELPTGVTLRGEWDWPDHPGEGTILMAYAGRGEAEGVSFIRMHPCSGIRYLSIWYPEQRADDIVPYPWTLEQLSGDNFTVECVTLVNPYQAIKIGPHGNELHLIRRVVGTPLKEGVFIDSTFDIGRLEAVLFGAKYWAESKLPGAPAGEGLERVKDFMRSNGRGIVMGRSDWEYMYGVDVEGYHTGLTIKRGKMGETQTLGASNAQFYQVSARDCREALRVEETNHIGLAFTDCVFEGGTALHVTETCTQGAIQFAGRLLRGKVRLHGSGPVSFLWCWLLDTEDADDLPFFEASGGALSISECKLGGTEGAVLKVGKGCRVFSFRRNDHSYRNLQLEVDEGGVRQIDLKEPWISLMMQPGDPADSLLRGAGDFMGSDPVPPLPAPTLLVAPSPTPGVDQAPAIQALLDALPAGGTVYLPAGEYRIEGSLHVPSGVELRGIWDVPHHTIGKGTVLMAVGGKGDADGAPLITLEANAGVRGITIYHPEQDFRDIQPYPWCVQGRGEGVYAINVTMSNAYQGIDFSTHRCDNHFIDYAAGGPLRTGIQVGGKGGTVRNMQFNPHYWARSPYPGHPNEGAGEIKINWQYMAQHLDALVVAGAENTWLQSNFVFASRNGIWFVEKDGIAPSATVIAHGSDAADTGARIDAAKLVKFTNFQAAAFHGEEEAYIRVGPKVGGGVTFENSLLWGQPKRGVEIEGGSVRIQQAHFVETGNAAIDLRGGRLDLALSTFRTPCDVEVRNNGTLTTSANLSADLFDVVQTGKGEHTVKAPNMSLLEAAITGWPEAALRHYRLHFGLDAALELRAGWYAPEPAGEWNNEGRKQWSKPGAKVFLPVTPDTSYNVELVARIPNEALQPGAGLYLGDTCVVPFERDMVGTLFGAFRTGNVHDVTLEVRCKAWKPVDVFEGSEDSRDLGIAARSLTVKAEGAPDRVYSANARDWD